MSVYVVNPAHHLADDGNAGTAARPWATTEAVTTFDGGPGFEPGDVIELHGRDLAPFELADSRGGEHAPITVRGIGGAMVSNRTRLPRGAWSEVQPGLWELAAPLGGDTGAWLSFDLDNPITAHGPSQGDITDRGVIAHQWNGGDLQIWTGPVGGRTPDLLGPLDLGSGLGVSLRGDYLTVEDLELQFVDKGVRPRAFISRHQVGVVVQRCYGTRLGALVGVENNGTNIGFTRAAVIANNYAENIGSSLVQLSSTTGGGNVVRGNIGRRIGQIYSTGGIYLGGGTTNPDRPEYCFVIDNDLEEVYSGNYFPGDGHGVEIDNSAEKIVVARNTVVDSRAAEGGTTGDCFRSNAGRAENWFIGNVGCRADRFISLSDAVGFGTRDTYIIGNTALNIRDRGINITGAGGTVRVHNNALEGLAAEFGIKLIAGAEGTVLEESGNVLAGFLTALDDATSAGYTLDPSSQEVADLELVRSGRFLKDAV